MNATYHNNNRSLCIALLVSLLFHLSLFISIAILDVIQPKNPEITIPAPQEFLDEQEKKETEWAETKTRSSHGGAPIFFRDDYSQTTNPTPANDMPADTQPQEADLAQDAQENKPEEPEQQTEKAAIIEENLDVEKTTIIQTRKATQPRKPLITPPRIRPSIINNKPHSTPSQKKLPSLAQLTQGMMNYMQEDGNHAVSMLGKKNGRPTDEQLKYERYLERLNQCLHNSFVTNADKQPVHPNENMDVTVFLALNEDGSIYNLKVVKSCGNRSLDLFVLSMLRDASSAFPPVPHYLPHNPFSIHYIITIGSSYYR